MPTNAQIFNQLLAEVSDTADTLQKICEKYSSLWEENMPYDAAVDGDEAAAKEVRNQQKLRYILEEHDND